MTASRTAESTAGTAFVISAPSGTGKSTLAEALVDCMADVQLSVSHTTRDRCAGEVDGREYHFATRARFEQMIDEGEFIEYATVYGHYYGTSLSAVAEQLRQGVDVLLDIDWQGERQVRNALDKVVSVFLLPPSMQELERRLLGRARDRHDVIQARMDEAVNYMRHCVGYDHMVVNDEYELALNDLKLLVSGRANEMRELPDGLLEALGLPATDA